MNPPTGIDLDPSLVSKLSDLLNGKYDVQDSNEEAQLRELAFWRWVAFEGYAGRPPLEFFDHQKIFMTSCFAKTGWESNKFADGLVFELGCGPIGMIEFVQGYQRWAFDPLNDCYGALFRKLRSEGIKYISDESDIKAMPLVDFGICFNVLDHTSDAASWFNLFFNKIKPGGAFLLQVNTIRDGFDRTDEHKKMHPSPMTDKQVEDLLSAVSDDFSQVLDVDPSTDNEFFFMAWGRKKS